MVRILLAGTLLELECDKTYSKLIMQQKWLLPCEKTSEKNFGWSTVEPDSAIMKIVSPGLFCI